MEWRAPEVLDVIDHGLRDDPRRVVLGSVGSGAIAQRASEPGIVAQIFECDLELFVGELVRQTQNGLATIVNANGSLVELPADSVLRLRQAGATGVMLNLNELAAELTKHGSR